jgi:hypothetical protein
MKGFGKMHYDIWDWDIHAFAGINCLACVG